jgi:hypothetical protein
MQHLFERKILAFTHNSNSLGAFLYSRSAEMTPDAMVQARAIISNAGLDPNNFCVVSTMLISIISIEITVLVPFVDVIFAADS